MMQKNAGMQGAGFSLAEVLVSVFVLSIGIFGVAGLQLSAFRSNQQSATAVAATQIAQDIAERIRANDEISSRGDGENPYLFDTDHGDAMKLTAKACYATECTPEDMAAADIYEWTMRIVGGPVKHHASVQAGATPGLPGGRGVICRDDTVWARTKVTGGHAVQPSMEPMRLSSSSLAGTTKMSMVRCDGMPTMSTTIARRWFWLSSPDRGPDRS